MRLTLAEHSVVNMTEGEQTRLEGVHLRINLDELKGVLLEDRRLQTVDLEIINPGELCRAGYVFDIVEPRAKEPGSGVDFPGILGPPSTAGTGTTHVLRGAAVTVVDGGQPDGELGYASRRGGMSKVLEMSGPAALVSPLQRPPSLGPGPPSLPRGSQARSTQRPAGGLGASGRVLGPNCLWTGTGRQEGFGVKRPTCPERRESAPGCVHRPDTRPPAWNGNRRAYSVRRQHPGHDARAFAPQRVARWSPSYFLLLGRQGARDLLLPESPDNNRALPAASGRGNSASPAPSL